jgi:glycosyltransferase involved in cell wall biosynthesis
VSDQRAAVLPRVSVIIPAYNAARFLPQAIDSVLAQTFGDVELLVVDDGSTDETPAVVARYDDPRVRYLRHARNRGLPAARNTGIRHARGELIAFLDADDYWLPEKLAVQVEALRDPAVDVCCVAAFYRLPDGTVVVSRAEQLTGDDLCRMLLFRAAVPGSGSSVIARRRCFAEVGLFDETMVALEDRDMWLRLAMRYRFAFVDVPLVSIDRRRPGSMVRDGARMARGYAAFLRNRERDLPPRLRYLLPRLRRFLYLRIGSCHYAAGDRRAAVRAYLRALAASWGLDAYAGQTAVLLARALLPPALLSPLRRLRRGLARIGAAS